MTNNELQHYGILGMKWGVRRYQNADGSLTPAGRKRYADDGPNEPKKNASNTFSSTQSSGPKETSAQPAQASQPKSVSEMTDAELNAFINRYNMEQRYKQIIESQNAKEEKKTSAAKEFVKGVLINAGRTALTNFVQGKMTDALNAAFNSKKKPEEKIDINALKKDLENKIKSESGKSKVEEKIDRTKKDTEYIETLIKNREAKERERQQKVKLREEKRKSKGGN